MLALTNPRDAYRKVDFDARVAGAGPQELVALCFEQFVAALGSALFAAEQADNRLKSRALTRALSALTALELGINTADPIASTLVQVFGAARRALLDNVVTFDAVTIRTVHQDFAEIGAALQLARR